MHIIDVKSSRLQGGEEQAKREVFKDLNPTEIFIYNYQIVVIMISSYLSESDINYLTSKGIDLALAERYISSGLKPDVGNILCLVEKKISPNLARSYIQGGVTPDAANITVLVEQSISPEESILEVISEYSARPSRWITKLPNNMKTVGPANPKVNCAGYALGKSRFLSVTETKLFLDELDIVEEASEGDIVVYFKEGIISHVGQRIENRGVRSKWGTGVVLEHEEFQVPRKYGCAEEYRSKK